MTLVLPNPSKPAYPASQPAWGKPCGEPISWAKSGGQDKQNTTADLC